MPNFYSLENSTSSICGSMSVYKRNTKLYISLEQFLSTLGLEHSSTRGPFVCETACRLLLFFFSSFLLLEHVPPAMQLRQQKYINNMSRNQHMYNKNCNIKTSGGCIFCCIVICSCSKLFFFSLRT